LKKIINLQFANREFGNLKNLIMKKHHGMRPQDIVILLKILCNKNQNWLNKEIADSLFISHSEVSDALNRCRAAKLIDISKRKVYTNALLEFLFYGLKYVFPVEPGKIVRGIATAHSAPPLNKFIKGGSDIYVWQYDDGNCKGQQIEPLYKTVPQSSLLDNDFYELLALLDAIRVGKARELKIAKDELEKRLKDV
jgi:predicted transcriptional regulator